MVFGFAQTVLNFFTYGKQHFTQTGYQAHAKKYSEPDFHDSVKLDGKTFMVTGSNSGIGKVMANYLAGKGATVYMVCRSKDRGEKAQNEIKTESGNKNVHLLVADVGLDADVRKMWSEFLQHQGAPAKLDGLVACAGALLDKRTLNAEGFETTFACHLAIGTYLLGTLAMPVLEATPGSRLVIVTSGGMYNSKYPGWETITSTAADSGKKYDGTIAYSWAKRGQVILAEEWAKTHTGVKIVTAHPGWAATEGVDSALANSKHLLEPMRTAWEGAEGMCWLLAVDADNIETGALYLDRSPQPKNISGMFWTEGGATKNTPDEVAMMMLNLERFINKEDPLYDVWRFSEERAQAKLSNLATQKNLVAIKEPIDFTKFMRKWYVLANIPIFQMNEQNYYNATEFYEWDEKNKRVQVVYRYYPMGSAEVAEARQHGYVKDQENKTTWALHPKFGIYLPLNLGYLVLHTAPDYSWTLIGVPDRKFLWVMTSGKPVPKDPAPYPVAADRAAQEAIKSNSNTKEEGPFLKPEEEAAIMREALLKAEACGYDISQVRLCGWYPEVPYPDPPAEA